MHATTVRLLLGAEAAAFAGASLVHRGWLAAGYQHLRAATAETVIGAVLLAGLALTFVLPRWLRAIGLTAQLFALLGTLVGVFVVLIGVGPQTPADKIYHGLLLLLVGGGLLLMIRAAPAQR